MVTERSANPRKEKLSVRTLILHLYVCPGNSAELRRHIVFRDFLRNDPDAAKKYSTVKETAARLYPNDIDKYMEYKKPCIEELYQQCGLK